MREKVYQEGKHHSIKWFDHLNVLGSNQYLGIYEFAPTNANYAQYTPS